MNQLFQVQRAMAAILLGVVLAFAPVSAGSAAFGVSQAAAQTDTDEEASPSVSAAVVAAKGHRVRITVKGQRFGKKATVTLRGYRGRARGTTRSVRVRATKALKKLKPGKYRVGAKRITWNGGVASPKKFRPKLVAVSKKSGASVTITYRQTKVPVTTPRRLGRIRWNEIKRRWGDTVSVAVAPLTSGPVAGVLGSGGQHAWSTAKVLLVSRVLSDVGGPDALGRRMRTRIRSSLSTSSNTAAGQIYEWLRRRHGGSVGASAAMTRLLRQAGDRTTVVAPGPTREIYLGHSIWTPELQVLYLRQVVRRCVLKPASTKFLLREMGHVVPEQSWGLGRVGSPAFKGGWGLYRQGPYLVRQLGILAAADGSQYVAAISVRPKSDTFGQGTRLITKVARWLSSSVASAPGPDPCKR